MQHLGVIPTTLRAFGPRFKWQAVPPADSLWLLTCPLRSFEVAVLLQAEAGSAGEFLSRWTTEAMGEPRPGLLEGRRGALWGRSPGASPTAQAKSPLKEFPAPLLHLDLSRKLGGGEKEAGQRPFPTSLMCWLRLTGAVVHTDWVKQRWKFSPFSANSGLGEADLHTGVSSWTTSQIWAQSWTPKPCPEVCFEPRAGWVMLLLGEHADFAQLWGSSLPSPTGQDGAIPEWPPQLPSGLQHGG